MLAEVIIGAVLFSNSILFFNNSIFFWFHLHNLGTKTPSQVCFAQPYPENFRVKTMGKDGSVFAIPWLDRPVLLHSSRKELCKLTKAQCEYRHGHWRDW